RVQRWRPGQPPGTLLRVRAHHPRGLQLPLLTAPTAHVARAPPPGDAWPPPVPPPRGLLFPGFSGASPPNCSPISDVPTPGLFARRGWRHRAAAAPARPHPGPPPQAGEGATWRAMCVGRHRRRARSPLWRPGRHPATPPDRLARRGVRRAVGVPLAPRPSVAPRGDGPAFRSAMSILPPPLAGEGRGGGVRRPASHADPIGCPRPPPALEFAPLRLTQQPGG